MSAQKPKRPPTKVPAATAQSLLDPAIWLGLLVTTFIVYGQVSRFEFIHYDDPVYVYQNVHVEAGLTIESIKWAFTSVVAGNWSPVTLLSHMLVAQFFRLQSGMHHLMNVVIHALAAIALFLALERASRDRWQSAFVAFVFALHPLHVESVAWISERKDVLSAFFWFLALYAYVRYAEQPSVKRYLLTVLPFCLGMMSKSMLVTFPFTLLLLDVWPLRRAQFPKVIWEKIPLLALCGVASAISFFTQQSGGAISVIPLSLRIENALISYVTYIGQTFWPTRLVWFYPYPDAIAPWRAWAACAVLLCVSALAVFLWRSRPYIATGWFWYLGTLVPVIGLVQIGAQSHADRYTYIPMVGLSMILAWGAAEVAGRWPRTKPAIALAGMASCCACMALASTQASYWQDGGTLFKHAVDATENNYWAKYNLSLQQYALGNELMNNGHRGEAVEHFEEALRVRPNWAEADNNLGILLAEIPGRSAEAMAHFEAAVRLDPNLAQAQRNLGIMLSTTPGRLQEAIIHLEAAQRLQPDPELLKIITRLRSAPK